jgi:hypothetical protein
MKFIGILLIVSVGYIFAMSLQNDASFEMKMLDEWQNFKEKFNKTYSTKEESVRYQVRICVYLQDGKEFFFFIKTKILLLFEMKIKVLCKFGYVYVDVFYFIYYFILCFISTSFLFYFILFHSLFLTLNNHETIRTKNNLFSILFTYLFLHLCISFFLSFSFFLFYYFRTSNTHGNVQNKKH